jgi:hypothetical protein
LTPPVSDFTLLDAGGRAPSAQRQAAGPPRLTAGLAGANGCSSQFHAGFVTNRTGAPYQMTMALVRDALSLAVLAGLLVVAAACVYGWMEDRRARRSR